MSMFPFCAFVLWISVSSAVKPAADEDWYNHGHDALEKLLNSPTPAPRRAKNVVLFIGDGMGVSTVTAARSFKGEINGNTGPEQNLVFEDFPHVALSKTYTQSNSVAGSAATATAIMTGVKTTNGLVGLNHHQPLKNCTNMEENKILGIMRWAQLAGKSTGFVTNTRVTHATPAAAYAHSAYREYEAHFGDEHETKVAEGCIDIATQLITGITGKDLNVVLGGGLSSFLPMDNVNGHVRKDNKDLIQEWKDIKSNTGKSYSFIQSRDELLGLNQTNDYLFGLFHNSHMNLEIERNKTQEPSLAEMTEAAIKTLSANDDGFVLMVEGGKLDHAHHASRAKAALVETLALEEAVQKAVELSNGGRGDTLIILTADHSHTLTIGGGYPTRGNSILNVVDELGAWYYATDDGKNMTTLGYANGPGGIQPGTNRTDPTNEQTGADDYVFQALVPMTSETHGGEDVGIYALGPMSHLFRGVMEQNVIAHVMAHAACIGDYADCSWSEEEEEEKGRPVVCDAASGLHYTVTLPVTLLVTLLVRALYG